MIGSRVIAFAGAKGGVGTTSVAANTAVALVGLGKRVVVAELRDSCGTLSHHLRPSGYQGLGLHDLLSVPPEAISDSHVSGCLMPLPSGIRVLYGPREPGTCPRLSPRHAEAIVEVLSRQADVVLLDLPPVPDPAAQAVSALCTSVMFVVEREPGALCAAKIVVSAWNAWSGAAVPRAIVLVNRVALAAPVGIEEAAFEIGLPIAAVIPPAPDLFVQAWRAGVPVVALSPDSLVGGSFQSFAAALAAGPAGQFHHFSKYNSELKNSLKVR